MKYFLVVGEASGDLHASNLMRSLREADKEADFRYFGGDLMQAVGGTLIKHYRELAYMGFIPVLLHLRTIFKNLELCKQAIEEYQPDVVIMVDYPGFNLKIAKFLKEIEDKRQKTNDGLIPPFDCLPRVPSPISCLSSPVCVYYISPKIWAWKEYRIKDIRKYVDKMLCILPFEVDFYKKHRYEVEYVGNPTVDAIVSREYASETFEEFTQRNQLGNKPILALLAGSRKQEIKSNLPTMLAAAAPFGDYQMVIAGAPGIAPDYYRQYTENHQVTVVFGQTYRLLQQSRAALVTSGTATLETALLRVPQLVCYRMPFGILVSFLFKHFFSCRYISLVNLIAGKKVVEELFGKDFSIRQIRNELERLLFDEAYRDEMTAGYREMSEKLGALGASGQAADCILRQLQ